MESKLDEEFTVPKQVKGLDSTVVDIANTNAVPGSKFMKERSFIKQDDEKKEDVSEDPMEMIKQKEENRIKAILENPENLKIIRESILKEKLKKELGYESKKKDKKKDKKSKKDKKKKRKKYDSDDDESRSREDRYSSRYDDYRSDRRYEDSYKYRKRDEESRDHYRRDDLKDRHSSRDDYRFERRYKDDYRYRKRDEGPRELDDYHRRDNLEDSRRSKEYDEFNRRRRDDSSRSRVNGEYRSENKKLYKKLTNEEKNKLIDQMKADAQSYHDKSKERVKQEEIEETEEQTRHNPNTELQPKFINAALRSVYEHKNASLKDRISRAKNFIEKDDEDF